MVVLVALAVPAIAVLVALQQTSQYTATAQLLFRDQELGNQLFSHNFQLRVQDPNRVATTNADLVDLDVVAQRTSRALHGALTKKEIRNKISISPKPGSDIIAVRATDPDPRAAAVLAQTFCDQFIAFRRAADRRAIDDAQRLLQARLAALKRQGNNHKLQDSLNLRSEQLSTLAALQTGNVELVQGAEVPTSRSSPRPVRNAEIGLLLGLVLGVALAILADRLDRYVRSSDELERLYGVPVLGTMPHVKGLGAGEGGLTLPAQFVEDVDFARANLQYFTAAQELHSVLVTSAVPREGKSTIAVGLAATAASRGSRVLLLEADLRKPVFASLLSLDATPGVSGVLAGGVELREAVERIEVVAAQAGGATAARHQLDVLPAGPAPPNPGELVESAAMAELVRTAAERYDLVIVDTPPVGVVADSVALLDKVSGVLLVARAGVTPRGVPARVRDRLAEAGVRVLGVVLNSVSADRSAPHEYYAHYETARGLLLRRATGDVGLDDLPSEPVPAAGNGQAMTPTATQPPHSDAATTSRGRLRRLVGRADRR